MNKLITSLLAAAVLIPTSAYAETKTIYRSKDILTKNVTTGNYNSTTTTSSVDVEVQKSATRAIVISAPDNIMEYVDVKVSGKELKIGYKTPVNLVLNNTKVVVKVTAPDVTTFTTGSSGDIDIESNLDVTGDVTFSTNSSGDIEAHAIKCKNFKAQTGSSGDIEAKNVACTNFNARTQSSGDIKIGNVSATTVYAETGSSGDIKLSGNCTDATFTTNSSGDIMAKSLNAINVKARTYSSGDIYCTGKNIDSDESSSGDIHVKRL